MHSRIGMASSAMNSMHRVWRQSRLSLDTKLRLYQTCILAIALYASETSTLLAEHRCRLQSIQKNCQRQLLGVITVVLSMTAAMKNAKWTYICHVVCKI